MWTQRILRVAWPAFMGACLLELVVFAVVDPLEMEWSGHALGLSRQTVYTLAFFVFWAISMMTTLLAVVLYAPAEARKENGGGPGA
ncbi:MAG: hypothetical protein ACAH21_12365 [Ramlibacter sp.]|nr:hypothetical protein [Ramlibacter sp.]